MAARSVRQTQAFAALEALGSWRSREGTETRAEVVLRMVRDRMLGGQSDFSYATSTGSTENKGNAHCHSIPEANDGKPAGRVER